MYNIKKLENAVVKLDKAIENADIEIAKAEEKEEPILVLVPSFG